jgi:DNA-binding XRE family transcriptional regulator
MSRSQGDAERGFWAEVGQRVQAKREQRGLSQTELGDHIGVHRNTVCRFESGDPISLWLFLRICDALSISYMQMLPSHAAHLGHLIRQVERERDPALGAMKVERDPPLTAGQLRHELGMKKKGPLMEICARKRVVA